MTAEDAPEETPANDVRSGDPPPPELEVEVERDPEEEFETRWRDFLAEVDNPDKPKWEKLYLRAQELFKHTQNPWMPDPGEDSIDDREELEKLVNEQLEEALDQEWREHMDRIRANEKKSIPRRRIAICRVAKTGVDENVPGGSGSPMATSS
jgi:hypothetical protein